MNNLFNSLHPSLNKASLFSNNRTFEWRRISDEHYKDSDPRYQFPFSNVHKSELDEIMDNLHAVPKDIYKNNPRLHPVDLVDAILTPAVIRGFIDGTNEHGANDPNYVHFDNNELNVSVFRLFFAMKGMLAVTGMTIHDAFRNTEATGLRWVAQAIGTYMESLSFRMHM